MSLFTGKSAIITGGASGIGRAIGEELARQEAVVILADRNFELAREAAAAITKGGGNARAAALDVTDAAAFEQLISDTAEEHGALDYLFNNAGIAIMAEAHEHELEDWYRTLDVNLRGVIHGVHSGYRLMRRQGHGHIVNIASIAGLIPTANEIAYATAKHGVVGLSTTLRAEAAEYGVKVSVVCPGFVDTPILYENLQIKGGSAIHFGSRDDVKKAVRFKAMPADKAARIILAGVKRNKALIPVTAHARFMWMTYRLYPPAMIGFMRLFIRDIRRRFPSG